MADQNKCYRTTIGGQALIEGILMRGPFKSAIVVRKPDKTLAIKETENGGARKNAFLRLPFVRGIVSLVVSLKEGMAALTYSAEFFEDEEAAEPSKFERFLERKLGNEKLEKILMGFALFMGVIIPIALFILLPTLLAGALSGIEIGLIRNLIEGALRIAIFLGFIMLVSRMKDIKRTFSYHGAEHKSIHCYEAGEELTVENVRKHTRMHPRCGTSFLFVVMIISILVFSLFSWSNPWIRMLIRILMLPVIVGISYEINRFCGRYDNLLTKILRAPGVWLQRFTTNEPDDSMIEVAIEALTRVIPEEQGADRW